MPVLRSQVCRGVRKTSTVANGVEIALVQVKAVAKVDPCELETNLHLFVIHLDCLLRDWCKLVNVGAVLVWIGVERIYRGVVIIFLLKFDLLRVIRVSYEMHTFDALILTTSFYNGVDWLLRVAEAVTDNDVGKLLVCEALSHLIFTIAVFHFVEFDVWSLFRLKDRSVWPHHLEVAVLRYDFVIQATQ